MGKCNLYNIIILTFHFILLHQVFRKLLQSVWPSLRLVFLPKKEQFYEQQFQVIWVIFTHGLSLGTNGG